MYKFFPGFLFTAFLCLSVGAQAAVFYPETFMLANGLQVVVVPNRLSPAVAQMVWYKVGSADEVPGNSGLAHYLEHLMFRGTEKMPAGTFSSTIAAQGGNDNAFTSYDYTAYHEVIAADRLGLIMQIEADRMQNLRITPETATPELSVVLNERDERTDNIPQGKFAERIRAVLFPKHPYGIPVIGWRKEMEQMSPERAGAFYKKHYAPNNAVVVISGNVETAEVMRLAASTFGTIPKHDLAVRPPLPKPEIPREKRVVMTDLRVQQPQLSLYTIVPSYATQTRNEAYAFEVLNEALDGGEVGALYRELVIRQKIASSTGISYDPQSRGPAVFTIGITPQPGKSTDDLEKAVNDFLRQLSSTGLDAAAITAAKERLTRSAVFARDSLMAPGYAFGAALATGGKIEDVESWPDRISAVTVDEVNAALRSLVASEYRVTGLLLPDLSASPEVRAKARQATPKSDLSIR